MNITRIVPAALVLVSIAGSAFAQSASKPAAAPATTTAPRKATASVLSLRNEPPTLERSLATFPIEIFAYRHGPQRTAAMVAAPSVVDQPDPYKFVSRWDIVRPLAPGDFLPVTYWGVNLPR